MRGYSIYSEKASLRLTPMGAQGQGRSPMPRSGNDSHRAGSPEVGRLGRADAETGIR